MADSLIRFIRAQTDNEFLIICQDYESLVGSAQDIIGDGEVFSADEKEVADHFNNGTDDNTTFAKFAAVLALKAAAKS